MSFHVQRQVVGACKASFAHLALEGLRARVLASVSGELVGASESPLAVLVIATIWFLAYRIKCEKGKQRGD